MFWIEIKKLLFPIVLIIVINLSLVDVGFTFDVNGFRSGMTKSEVVGIVKSDNLGQLGNNDKVLIHEFSPGHDSFHFDDNYELISYGQNLSKPTFERFVLLLTKYKRKYGKPFRISTETPDPENDLSQHSITVYWSYSDDVMSVCIFKWNYPPRPGYQVIINYETLGSYKKNNPK